MNEAGALLRGYKVGEWRATVTTCYIRAVGWANECSNR